MQVMPLALFFQPEIEWREARVHFNRALYFGGLLACFNDFE